MRIIIFWCVIIIIIWCIINIFVIILCLVWDSLMMHWYCVCSSVSIALHCVVLNRPWKSCYLFWVGVVITWFGNNIIYCCIVLALLCFLCIILTRKIFFLIIKLDFGVINIVPYCSCCSYCSCCCSCLRLVVILIVSLVLGPVVL